MDKRADRLQQSLYRAETPCTELNDKVMSLDDRVGNVTQLNKQVGTQLLEPRQKHGNVQAS